MLTDLMPTTQRALLRRLAIEQSASRIPSLISIIVRDGEIIWFGARGLVADQEPTADTQYRIGSITKTFIAVLIMRLRDEGILDLNDKLDDYVPGTAVGQWSIGQILSHSTPLRAEPAGAWWERTHGGEAQEFLDKVDKQAVRTTPQHVFHYSNVGFGILGELIARIRGASWDKVVTDEILRPLRMSRTTMYPTAPHAQGFAVHPWADAVMPEPAEYAGAMAPAGQLWSTAEDMGRWLSFLCGDTGDVLSADTLGEMRAPGAVEDSEEWRSAMGLGLQLARHRGLRLAGHSGSMPGFLATVLADPEGKTGIAFMANTTAGMSGTLITDLFDILNEHEPRIPSPWRPESRIGEELLQLTGQWYWGPTPYLLRILSPGMLALAPWQGRGRASRFHLNDDGTWTGLDGYYAGEVLRVGKTTDGDPYYLELNTFIFTRSPYDAGAPVPGDVGRWQPL